VTRVREHEEAAVHLYRAYVEDLRVAREAIRERLWQYPGKSLDDIEGELTYLLIRERRPEVAVEIGARATAWIERALHDNGAGTLVKNTVPAAATFVFIDEWWRPQRFGTGTMVAVRGDRRLRREVRRTLAAAGVTPLTAGDPDTRDRLLDLKRKLRISAPIRHSSGNPTLFYETNGTVPSAWSGHVP
jgi:hypothetical protein